MTASDIWIAQKGNSDSRTVYNLSISDAGTNLLFERHPAYFRMGVIHQSEGRIELEARMNRKNGEFTPKLNRVEGSGPQVGRGLLNYRAQWMELGVEMTAETPGIAQMVTALEQLIE